MSADPQTMAFMRAQCERLQERDARAVARLARYEALLRGMREHQDAQGKEQIDAALRP